MKHILYLIVLLFFFVSLVSAQTGNKINSEIGRDKQKVIRLENAIATVFKKQNHDLLHSGFTKTARAHLRPRVEEMTAF